MISWKLGLLILLLFLSILAFHYRIKDEMIDFEVNWKAGLRLRTGETLYRETDGHYQFKYLPFSAFLYLPLTYLPLSWAKGVWFALVLLSSVLIFYLSHRLIRVEGSKNLVIPLFAAFILARYFIREIQLGQINAFITLLLVLMISFLCRKDSAEKEAGFFQGLASALKLYALIFLPYFLLRKKWLSLGIGLLVLGLALLAPSLFYGIKGNFVVLGEWKASLSLSSPPLFSSQDNVSLIGLLAKWAGRLDLALLFYLIILFFLGVFLFFLLIRGKNVSSPLPLDGFLLLGLIPLLSPLGWDYTFLSWAPALVLLLYHFPKFPPLARVFLVCNLAFIALSLYDLMGRDLYSVFMNWSVITINFLILFVYLSYLRVQKIA